MIYGGIDYSINCPSLCVYDDDDGPFGHDTCRYWFNQNNISKKEELMRKEWDIPSIFPQTQFSIECPEERYFVLADWFISILVLEDVKVVAMEDYALGASGLVFNIAECTGMLKSLMHSIGIEFYRYPPTAVKKTFAGKGNADKDAMVAAYREKYGIDMIGLLHRKNTSSPVSDVVDSHAMLYHHFTTVDCGVNISSNCTQ